VRYEDNLGYDGDIVRVLDSIETDFVWFLGDDDILLARALDDVIAAIDSTSDAGVIVCRAQFFHETEEIIDRAEGASVEPIVLQGAEFMYRTAFTAAALSTLCVSTEAMRSIDLDFARDSFWVHFGALISIVSKVPPGPSVFIDDGLVAVRRSNSARWFAHFGNQYQTGLRLLTMIQSGLEHGVDTGIYDFFRARRFANNHLDVLTLAWPLSWSARRELHAVARSHFSGYPRFWIIDVPLLFTPNWLKALGSASIRLAGRGKRLWVKGRGRA
jgi:hypothetical protein